MSRRYFGGIRDRIKQRARFLNLTDADYQWVKIKGAFDWRSKRITFDWEEPKDYLSSFLKKSERVFSQEEESGEDPALNDSLRWLYAGTEGRSPESMMPPRAKQEPEQNYLPPDVGIEAELPDLDEYKAEIVSALRRRNIKVGTDKISLPEDLEKELYAFHTGQGGEVDSFELRSRLQQFKKQVIDASEQFSNLKGVGGIKVDTPSVLSPDQPLKEEVPAAPPVEAAPEAPAQETPKQELPKQESPAPPQPAPEAAKAESPSPASMRQARPAGERLDKERLGGDRIARNGLSPLQDAPHMRPRVIENNEPPDLEKTQPESPYAPTPTAAAPKPEVEETPPTPEPASPPINEEAKEAVLRAFNAKKNGTEDAEAAAKALAERIKRNEEDADATSVSINAILPPLEAMPVFEDNAPPPVKPEGAPEIDIDEVVSGETIELSVGETMRLKRALEALEGPSLSLEDEPVTAPEPAPEPPVAEPADTEQPQTAEKPLEDAQETVPESNGAADLKLVKKPEETAGDSTAILLQNILEEVDQQENTETEEAPAVEAETAPTTNEDELSVQEGVEEVLPAEGEAGRSQYIQDQRAKLYLLINKLEEESGIADLADRANADLVAEEEAAPAEAAPGLDAAPNVEAEQPLAPEVSSPEPAPVEAAVSQETPIDEFEQLEAALEPEVEAPVDVPAEPEGRVVEESIPEEAAETAVELATEAESVEEEPAQSQPGAETPVSESIPAESPEAPMDKPEDAFAEKEMPVPEASAEEQEAVEPEVTAERPLWEETMDEELEASMAINEEDVQPEQPAEAEIEEATLVEAAAPSEEKPAAEEKAPVAETEVPEEPTADQGERVSIESMLEVLAFASDEPVPLKKVARIYAEFTGDRAPTETKLLEAVDSLNASYAKQLRTFRIKVWANGVRMATEPAYSAYVRKLYHQEQQKKLSRTLMETLAIVAYSQPITKPELDFVRGVDSDYAVRKLLEMGLVDIVGRSDSIGRPLLYGTSERFLDQFGLSGLEALPKLREIEDLLGDPAFSKERMHLLALENLDARLGAQAEGEEESAEPAGENADTDAGENEVTAAAVATEPETPGDSKPAPKKKVPARAKSKSSKAKPKSDPPPPAE